MRKIEALMNVAIKNNTNWSKANTSVTNEDGVSTVYLHGNKIAEVGDDFVRVFDGGWQSNTTKSRLNAIINEFCNAFTDGIFQKDFAWYVRDNKVVHDFVNGYTFAEFAWATLSPHNHHHLNNAYQTRSWGSHWELCLAYYRWVGSQICWSNVVRFVDTRVWEIHRGRN